MEAEEEPELDISQLLPPPSGFIAFAGSGNRSDSPKLQVGAMMGRTFLDISVSVPAFVQEQAKYQHPCQCYFVSDTVTSVDKA